MDGFDRLKKHLEGPPKVTQREFADELGLAQSLISMLVNKQRRPPLEAVPVLNKKLGTTLTDWIKPKLARGKAA